MFLKLNTVKQGTVGVGAAIYEFTKRDWCVSVPVNDIQPYDLVVDDGEGLKKVQVKTTRYKENSKYVVQLKSVRPNRTANNIRRFDSSEVDYLFILCEDETQYLIPANTITVGASLALGTKYDGYMVRKGG